MNDLVKQEWYEHLVEECKAIITEAVFTSRWALVEGYWLLGKRIEEEVRTRPINLIQLFQALEKSITKCSKTTFYYAHKLSITYPDIQKLPEGKNISWNKLITKYLPEPIIEKIEIPLPEGVFSILYADPPWDIGSMVLDKWESPLEDKYPTMPLKELKALKLPTMAEDSVCFMWTTLSTLPQALELLAHWGFKYHITITWDKGNGWSACGFHRRTELCLFGYRGILSNVVKQEGEFIPTIFAEPKREHSRKPEKMYNYIENRTIGPKIELFARTKREGWTSWGNEV